MIMTAVWHRLTSLKCSLRCCLLLAILLSFEVVGCSQFGNQPPEPQQVAQALVGRWQAVDEKAWDGNLVLIFRSDGSFVGITDRAYTGRYWIKPTAFPMAIDLQTDDSYSLFRGVFRLVDSRTLELQRKAVGISDPVRPTDFSGVKLLYQKVSSETTLPPGIQRAVDRSPSIALRENLGKSYVISMLFAQRTYFDKQRQFTTHLFHVHPGFSEEDIDYRYRVVVQGNVFWLFGLPKSPDLKSFTGGLATGVGYASTIRLCATDSPSQQPAAMYKLSDRLDFECGNGSHPE